MKFISKSKNFTGKFFLTSIMVVIAVASVAINSNAHAANISFNTPRDCNSNAVMYCGATSLSQLQSQYYHGVAGYSGNGGKAYSIQDIYHAFGISPNDISNMSNNAVAGYVTKSGNVYLANGKLVATDVMTAGRTDFPGSTKVKYGATTFYERPPRVSFESNSISAYVVMVNGTFRFAILSSCGNPVTGHAIPKPTPTPTRKPTPTPTPHHYACVNYACVQVTGAGGNTCSSNANCQPAHHYACVNYACVQVTGAGGNTCSSNTNCQPKPTICTPTPTPYSNW